MFISKVCLREDVTPYQMINRLKGDGYHIHKMVWRLFSSDETQERDFIYRYEAIGRVPSFYIVSARQPNDKDCIWDIQTKSYAPRISNGDDLAFTLRVNPVVIDKQVRSTLEVDAWLSNREEQKHQKKKPTKKRIRHDVVMEAKRRVQYQNLPQGERPPVEEIIQDAGITWLEGKQSEGGFRIKTTDSQFQVRADGYYQHKLFKGKAAKPITFSTLDFNGILTVTASDVFINKCLYQGIGPAKGFGCGLMLVKRV